MLDLNPRSNDASFILDFLRVIASQIVCLFHAFAFFHIYWLRPPHVPFLQNFGVCIFFILSGFLISHTLIRKSQDSSYGFADYFIDRIVRIYSGLIPAICVVAIADWWLTTKGVNSRGGVHDLQTVVGNLLMLQNYNGLGSSLLQVPIFGTDGPLWTLAIEFHLYLAAGALFFLYRGKKPLMMLAIFMIFTQLPFAYLSGIALTFLWVGGFVVAVMIARGDGKVPYLVWAAMWCFSTGLLAYQMMRVPMDPFSPILYGPLLLSFTSMIALALRTNITSSSGAAWLRDGVRFIADYSYTLYLVHFTLLYGLSKFLPLGRLRSALVAVLLSNIAALVIAIPTEMQHKRIANWIKATIKCRKPVFVARSNSD